MGYTGTVPVDITVTINSGVVLSATSTSVAGFNTSTIIAGSTLSIINNGYIIGMGGAGGSAYGAGLPGGAALDTRIPLTITNANGYICGGGGQGGWSDSGQGGKSGTTGPSGTGGAVGIPRYGSGASAAGGNYGATGGSGRNNSNVLKNNPGAAGNAIALHGNSVTWVSGNNGTHVVGAVS